MEKSLMSWMVFCTKRGLTMTAISMAATRIKQSSTSPCRLTLMWCVPLPFLILQHLACLFYHQRASTTSKVGLYLFKCILHFVLNLECTLLITCMLCNMQNIYNSTVEHIRYTNSLLFFYYHRFSRTNRIFAGLWFGYSKPDFCTFLKPFAESLHELYRLGMLYFFKLYNNMHNDVLIVFKSLFLNFIFGLSDQHAHI